MGSLLRSLWSGAVRQGSNPQRCSGSPAGCFCCRCRPMGIPGTFWGCFGGSGSCAGETRSCDLGTGSLKCRSMSLILQPACTQCGTLPFCWCPGIWVATAAAASLPSGSSLLLGDTRLNPCYCEPVQSHSIARGSLYCQYQRSWMESSPGYTSITPLHFSAS